MIVPINFSRTLKDYFSHVENTIGDISIDKIDSDYVIELENMLEHYGVRVFYVSDSVPTVTEIPLNSGEIYFKKGEVSYPKNSAAGYIDRLYIKNLNNDKNLKVIVIKTTSEKGLYKIVGKSSIASY